MAFWATIEDSKWLIGFTAPIDWAVALVAACASEPSSIESMLANADFYYRGLVVDVVDRLIEADRVRMGKRGSGLDIVAAVEERVGEKTSETPITSLSTMSTPVGDGNLSVLLQQHRLSASGRLASIVLSRGELEIFDHGHSTGRYVTYQLPARWSLHLAKEAR